ncbi:16S rRNA (cytosine(1402)-N(4))-methyltransferase RsmH [Verrucomicrobiales bacterium]|nr:16S rRNA (cytosine(1402)-N(4))-methyltransferase RsmH [Verrucomicrobiales bacterium]
MNDVPHQRRKRYSGKNPRRFEDKYKELDPNLDPATVAKVIASGKTPAGQHRPILVDEILERLAPQPGERGADVTFGYGGHSQAILERLGSTGQLLALDCDSVQLPKTEARLRGLGYGEDQLIVRQSNYAGLAAALKTIGWDDGVDFLLADLGLSSMQIDNPARGFSYKHDGPLDMRMNPAKGLPAREWLEKCREDKLVKFLEDGGDEPHAEEVAAAIKTAIAHGPIATTGRLRKVIESIFPRHVREEETAASVTRVFQAIRIAVNEEFTALDAFLGKLPSCLRSGATVAILSFHSGEDRRVKRHFKEGFHAGTYSEISPEIIRPSRKEIGENSRAAPAKMRWAVRADVG